MYCCYVATLLLYDYYVAITTLGSRRTPGGRGRSSRTVTNIYISLSLYIYICMCVYRYIYIYIYIYMQNNLHIISIQCNIVVDNII